MAAILKKMLSRHNSARVPSVFMKFGKLTHFGHLCLSSVI